MCRGTESIETFIAYSYSKNTLFQYGLILNDVWHPNMGIWLL